MIILNKTIYFTYLLKSEVSRDDQMINALKSLDDLVSGLKQRELEELLYGNKRSHEDSKSSSSDILNFLEKKSFDDSQTRQDNYQRDYQSRYRRKSRKRNFNEIDTYDLKELEELVDKLLEKK